MIHEVANYVLQHPGLPHKVQDLAARAGLSPRYFSIKFKEIIGMSVQSYIIKSRIDRAQHLLLHAGMNVTEVADALGYRDIFFSAANSSSIPAKVRRKSDNESDPVALRIFKVCRVLCYFCRIMPPFALKALSGLLSANLLKINLRLATGGCKDSQVCYKRTSRMIRK